MSWIIDGAYAFLFGWVDLIPFGWYGISFIAGAIVGAWLGKPTVAAILAILGVLLFWKRKDGETHEHVSGRDAAVPKPQKLPKKRKYLLDGLWKK